jgi:hypothetical protein
MNSNLYQLTECLHLVSFFLYFTLITMKKGLRKNRDDGLKKASNSFVKDQLVRENSDNSIVKPVYNNHNWDKKLPLLKGGRCSKVINIKRKFKMVIYRWSPFGAGR